MQNRWHLVQRVSLIWLFTSLESGHECNCWLKVVEIVNHWDKREMCTGIEIKSGSELVRMETDIHAPLLR